GHDARGRGTRAFAETHLWVDVGGGDHVVGDPHRGHLVHLVERQDRVVVVGVERFGGVGAGVQGAEIGFRGQGGARQGGTAGGEHGGQGDGDQGARETRRGAHAAFTNRAYWAAMRCWASSN